LLESLLRGTQRLLDNLEFEILGFVTEYNYGI